MSKLLDDAIRKELSTDALVDAERITGQSYKDDPLTMALGMAGHLKKVQDKDALLSLAGDTTFSEGLGRYLEIVQGVGFEVVYTEPFHDAKWNQDDTLYVLFRPDGILLKFDTFGGKSVNGGKFHYNWLPSAPRPAYDHSILSSGHYCQPPGWKEGEPMVWSGDHDCREALVFHIRQLEEHGKFVSPWVDERHYLQLNHYADWERDQPWSPADSARTTALSDARIAKLPEHVRRAIGKL